jgi:hypothetical protein
MQSVGFKEWALVCEALGRGEQTILLRKGGIAEGREGFGFRHPEFFLFPTFFHEQLVKVRTTGVDIPAVVAGEVSIRYFAKVAALKEVTSWPAAAALEPFHILEESVVRERFEHRDAGLRIAFVRVFRLEPVWTFRNRPVYGGCRSWVTLPEPPATTRFESVLSDEEYAERARRFSAGQKARPAYPRFVLVIDALDG